MGTIKDKKLGNPKKVILNTALTGICVVSLYSGISLLTEKDKPIEQPSITSEVETPIVPECYQPVVRTALGLNDTQPITKEDLSKIDSYLLLHVKTNDDLSFLNECTNLQSLYIIMMSDNMDVLTTINEIPNLKKFSFNDLHAIGAGIYSDSLTLSNCRFLYECPTLEHLELNDINVDMTLINSLPNLKKLSLEKHGLDANYYNLDYSKLTNLDELQFVSSSDNIYDIATFLDTKTYNILIESGVDVKFTTEEDRTNFLLANSRLELIAYELGLELDASKEEKLVAITKYILDNLTYDEDFENGNYDTQDEVNDEFYKQGLLYGAIYKDTQICGNYAALFQALAKRFGIDTNLLISKTHAWNLVSLGDEYYLIDPTWLDQMVFTKNEIVLLDDGSYTTTKVDSSVSDLITVGNLNKLKWYMANAEDVEALDTSGSHDALNLPSYLEITRLEEQPEDDFVPTENIEKLDDEVFVINIQGEKKRIVPGAVLIGLALACGSAVLLSNKKDKMKKEIINEIMHEFHLKRKDFKKDDHHENKR